MLCFVCHNKANMSDFANKAVAVVGVGRSGLACAEVLGKLGADVRLYDSKPVDQMPDAVAAAAALGLTITGSDAPIETRGLDWVVTSPGVPKTSPQLLAAVASGVPVIGEIEAAYRISAAPIVAITGTNGKTTCTVLVGEMLRASGKNAYIGGNIAAGELALPLIKAAQSATPDETIVAEISSFQLEWIDAFRPRVASLLNITPDHGDRQTWDEYVAAKWRIFENQGAGDLAVMSDALAADPRARFVKAEIARFGPAEAAGIVETVLPVSDVRLPGRHNVNNLAAAILMARAAGASEEGMAQVARTFSGVVHRLECVATIDGVRYVNNSMCTNVDAFENSLAALPEPKIVIVGGVFKGEDPSPLAASVLAYNVRGVVTIGKSGPAIAAVLRAAGFDNLMGAGGLREALALARRVAQRGDTVILAPACASFDMFRDFEDRGDQFKQAVRLMEAGL